MTPPTWTWILLVVIAAAAQTLRNAAQKKVSGTQGPLPATLVRFVYGLPFACLWLAAVMNYVGVAPTFTWQFLAWTVLGAMGQLFATAFLLMAMSQRNFVVSVVYAKTEIVQLVVLAWLILGDAVPSASVVAVIVATVGVIILSTNVESLKKLEFARSLFTPAAGYGFASGTAFAFSLLGYRGAALSVPDSPAFVTGAFGLVCAQTMQTVLLGSWLYFRQPGALRALAGEWRMSVTAGALGTIASVGWLTSVALHNAAEVRALGLIEIFFSYAVSRKLLDEKVSGTEIAGGLLIMVGVVLICLRVM
jgi:drug/metabolite transporter (DMT)-like permease